MSGIGHDTLVRRLAMMLVKLNQGESLEPRELAHEFGVNIRTIQRDINERFGYLPLERHEGRYRMSPAFLGHLSLKDIQNFASLAGVSGLFPSLTTEFLQSIFDARVESALLVKGHSYENLSGRESDFKLLEQAIVSRHCVNFSYQASSGATKEYEAEPHKLMNVKGIWYLAARHDEKLKTFALSRLVAPTVTTVEFQLNPALLQQLDADDGIWMSEQSIEVVLTVDAAVAPYFRRRKLIANQVIVKELVDGSLIVSARVGHANQILPIVRYWIPHLKIVAPQDLALEFERGLRGYILKFGSGDKLEPRTI